MYSIHLQYHNPVLTGIDLYLNECIRKMIISPSPIVLYSLLVSTNTLNASTFEPIALVSQYFHSGLACFIFNSINSFAEQGASHLNA